MDEKKKVKPKSASNRIPLLNLRSTDLGAPAPTEKQSASLHRKAAKILELLGEEVPLSIVFVDTRAEAWLLSSLIRDALTLPEGSVLGVTAQLPQKQREDAAQAMRDGSLRVVVATSTWATGLDIPALRFVFLTGRSKAPIGALQSVGRVMRVGEDKPGYEIINLVDVGAEHAAQRREDILLEEGFIKSLESEPAVAVQQKQPAHSGWLFGDNGLFGPVWLWQLVGVYMVLRLIWELVTGT